MTSYRVVVTRQAGADLSSIRDYIARDSEQNAAKMIGQIFDAFDLLGQSPHRTSVEEKSARTKYPVRTVAVWPYVIYFQAIDNEKVVRILTIRHGARRRPRQFD